MRMLHSEFCVGLFVCLVGLHCIVIRKIEKKENCIKIKRRGEFCVCVQFAMKSLSQS